MSRKELPRFEDAVLHRKRCYLPQLLLAPLLFLLLSSTGCSFSTGDSSGDSQTGDTTTGNGPANVTATHVDSGGDSAVNIQPNNVRNPDNLGLNPAALDGACFIEVYKPDSENGAASVLFSDNCPAFSSVCMFRRPLNQIPPGVEVPPEVPVSEQSVADNFTPFEESCGTFTSRQEGIAKWAFELPGGFYTGDIVAEVAGQVLNFAVDDPAKRQENVAASGFDTTPNETAVK